MKKHLITLIPCLLLGSFAPPVANAEDSTQNTGSLHDDLQMPEWLKTNIYVGFESLHVYRAVDSSYGQSNIWETVAFDLFDMVHLQLYNGNSYDGRYKELTPSGYIYKKFGPVTVAGGMIWYHFPGNNGVDSQEYYLNVSADLGAGFSVSGWSGYNKNIPGWYHEVKLGYGCDLMDRLRLEAYTSVAYSYNYRGSRDGFDNITVGVNLPIDLTHGFTLTPSAGYAFALNMLDSDNEGWAALTLTYSF